MIYLDHNSTTPVDPRVVERMLPFFAEQYGNASSTTHEMGRVAKQAVEDSRTLLAEGINASPDEIYFTSGATESNNLAIRGLATHRSTKRKQIVTAATEHRAVLDPVKRLEREGFETKWADTQARSGAIELAQLEDIVGNDTAIVSLMWANNEIGTLHPMAEVGRICHGAGAVLHCDAAQALGRHQIDVQHAKIDLLSLSGHKVYGPKGIGAVYVRRGTRLKAIIDGGGHEGGKRSGTLNVPGIVGFAAAFEIALQQLDEEESRIRELMQACDSMMQHEVGGVSLNGPPVEERLLGNLNYQLDGIDAETLTLNLPEVCLSTGSACTSADPEPSHVLQAIGLSESEARSSVRLGIGRFNSLEQIKSAVVQIATEVRKLRDN